MTCRLCSGEGWIVRNGCTLVCPCCVDAAKHRLIENLQQAATVDSECEPWHTPWVDLGGEGG